MRAGGGPPCRANSVTLQCSSSSCEVNRVAASPGGRDGVETLIPSVSTRRDIKTGFRLHTGRQSGREGAGPGDGSTAAQLSGRVCQSCGGVSPEEKKRNNCVKNYPIYSFGNIVKTKDYTSIQRSFLLDQLKIRKSRIVFLRRIDIYVGSLKYSVQLLKLTS